jgi:hypothetical protein
VQVNANGVLTIDDFRNVGEVIVGGMEFPPREMASP